MSHREGKKRKKNGVSIGWTCVDVYDVERVRVRPSRFSRGCESNRNNIAIRISNF